MSRLCFHSDDSFRRNTDGMFVVAIVKEDESGYWVASTWPTLDAAQAEAAQRNTELGLSTDDVLDIRTASMALHFAEQDY